MWEKSNKITKWAVLCLALCSCSNVANNGDKVDSKNEKDSISPIENVKFAPPEYDWENATFIDAFNAGVVSNLYEYVEKAPHMSDTIIVNKNNYNKRLCGGLYSLKTDKVHLKYYIADTTGCTEKQKKIILASVKRWNSKITKMANKAHEYHHRYIHKKKVFKTPLSAEDYARVCGHNEIAAYTTTLLYEREIVKRAIMCGKPAEEWRKMISTRFSAYWDAVEKGEVNLINPLLNNERLDNYLIIQTSSNWWLEHEYDKNVYITEQKLGGYLKNVWAPNYPRNEKNYQKVLDDCYTFLKDGKLVNLNIFYKKGEFMAFGHTDVPNGIIYKDFDNQPKIKEMIAKEREKAKLKQDTIKKMPQTTNKIINRDKSR